MFEYTSRYSCLCCLCLCTHFNLMTFSPVRLIYLILFHSFIFRVPRVWTPTMTTVSTLSTQGTGHKTSSEMLVSVCLWLFVLCTCAWLCLALTSLSSVVQAWPTDLKNTPSFESWSDWRTNSSPPPTPLLCMLKWSWVNIYLNVNVIDFALFKMCVSVCSGTSRLIQSTLTCRIWSASSM